MSDSEQSEMVNKFVEVTKADQASAKLYLETAAWDMETALSSFYDHGSNSEPLNDSVGQSSSRPNTASNRNVFAASASNYKPVPKPKKSQPYSGIMTLSSLKNAEDEGGESENEEGQRFFAGGSQTSGQQIIGPPRTNADLVANMFQEARKHASASASSVSGRSVHESGSSNFSGTGYKLGQTENDTVVIPSRSTTSKRSSNQEEVVLKMWSTGFTINDGELHRYDVEENKQFLDSVSGGTIPQSFLKEANVSNTDELKLRIEDHKYENYVSTKPKNKPFGGSGNVLGSPVPEMVVNSPKDISSDNSVVNDTAARHAVPLTPGDPITTLQIRLEDGTKITAQFNRSHTIGDVRRYIIAARPRYASIPFQLQTSFPVQTLENDNNTLSDAQLINVVIYLRINT